MLPTKEIFIGPLIKDCPKSSIYEKIEMLYLRCLATIGHTRPDPANLEISIAIVVDDLMTHYPYLHFTELDLIFFKGIRHELTEFTIFAPVEVYKWFKKWYEAAERAKLRNEHLVEKNNLLPAAQESAPQVDYEKWLSDALALHRMNKKQLGGLHLLYDYLEASNRIKRQWPEFREKGKARMENQLLSGKTSRPMQLRGDISKADTAIDGTIKAVCIELAMEWFFNEMAEV